VHPAHNSAILVTMDKHIPIAKLKASLNNQNGKYSIYPLNHSEQLEITKSWFKTYKPILLIFTYILATTGIIQFTTEFNLMTWMRHFMASFFLVFSFFKLLNLKGFVDSYAMYDIVAIRLPFWGYIYAFLELSLGIMFLADFYPLVVNIAALVIMSVSIIGVLKSVLGNQTIKCACLGDVFNLPMSTVTIIEDGLMILMSSVMIWMLV